MLLGLVLALVLISSLVSTMPARLLGVFLPGDAVVMQGFRGTLWRGSASRVLVHAGAGYLHLGAVQWSLRPLSLLLLAPRLEIESRWGKQRLVGELIVRGARDLEMRDFDASFPAELVRHFAPVELQGTLSAQLTGLRLRDGLPQSADGRLVWQQAAWLSPMGSRPLGTYAVDFRQPPGGTLAGQIQTLSGPVEASGSIELTGRAYRIDILLAGQGPFEPQLQQALSLVASPRGDDFQLVLDGEFQ
jgi:hypothetical protein